MPEDRDSIVQFIESRAKYCEAKKNDPTHGHYYRGLITVYRALASDVSAKLDLHQ